MADIKININTDNDAFLFRGELTRILNQVAEKFEDGYSDFSINDINGNKVCEVTSGN